MTKSEPSKVTGNLKAAQGAVKETLGAAVGAKQMESEGKATRAEGNTELEAAKAKGYAEGAGDSLAGGLKKNVAKVTGNDKKEAEGKARQTKGDAKKAANK
ncbi:TPA: hypothetical protein ACH3X1_006511 [Trebouxia sp. C0004]